MMKCMRDDMDGRADREFVEGLARGLSVIEAFDADTPEMTLSEIARKTGHSPAAARRSIFTLVTLGYMRKIDRRFVLSPKILLLGAAYFRAAHIEDALLPELHDFVSRHGDASSIAVLHGPDVIYVAHQAAQTGIARATAGTGATYPAHVTSLGRVLIASLPNEALDNYLRTPLRALTDVTVTDPAEFRALIARARADGYATAVDQLSYGVTSLSVPIKLASGETIAAVNTSGYTGRTTPERLVAERLADLRACASRIADIFVRYPALLNSLRNNR